MIIAATSSEGIVVFGSLQDIVASGAIVIHSRHECFMAEYCAIGELVPVHLALMCPPITTEHFLNRDRPCAISKADRQILIPIAVTVRRGPAKVC